MNAVSQCWIGGLRTRKAKVAGSIPAGGCFSVFCRVNIGMHLTTTSALLSVPYSHNGSEEKFVIKNSHFAKRKYLDF